MIPVSMGKDAIKMLLIRTADRYQHKNLKVSRYPVFRSSILLKTFVSANKSLKFRYLERGLSSQTVLSR